MLRARWKGFIRLSLVSVPVEGYTASAAGETQISLNQLHNDDCHGRIRYRKVCEVHGEEVSASDIVMGYQFDKDQYVVIDPEEIEKLRSERDYSINVDRFVDPEKIDPMYFAGRSYYLLPTKGGDKPYALLNRAMRQENVYGLAQVVISNREQLVVLRPIGRLLTITMLQYAANVRGPEQFEELLGDADVSKQELQLAKTLILATKVDDPELEEFHDLYNQRLKELVEAKVEGREITSPKESAPQPTINYMDAIRASLQRRGKSAAKKAPATKKPARAAVKKRKIG
jgi:DNA end-binding protein Ku